MILWKHDDNDLLQQTIAEVTVVLEESAVLICTNLNTGHLPLTVTKLCHACPILGSFKQHKPII